MTIQTFNVLLCGDSSVGKTTFVNRIATGEFMREHVETVQNTNSQLKFNTTCGLVAFNIIEQRVPDTTVSFNGAIIMYSMCDANTFPSIRHTRSVLTNVINDKFITIVGNKVDIVAGFRSAYNGVGIQNYTVSSRTKYHIEKPFLYLTRQLLGDSELCFIPFDPIEPPTIVFVAKPMHCIDSTPNVKIVNNAQACKYMQSRSRELNMYWGVSIVLENGASFIFVTGSDAMEYAHVNLVGARYFIVFPEDIYQDGNSFEFTK